MTKDTRPGQLVPTLACVVSLAGTALAQPERSDQRSVVQRGARPVPSAGAPRVDAGDAAVFALEFRTIDGTHNNLANPLWGAAGTDMIRIVPPAYADGSGAPSGGDRPSARAISNAVNAQDVSIANELGLSDFMWQWGQFLDHDLDETPVTSPGEPFDIEVPAGDPWFDPAGTGTVTIPLDRSAYDLINGVRQQINNITAYIDASNVYGSEEDLAHELRTLDGTGRLETSAGDLLPFNVNGFPNAPTANDPSFFLAGDIRANEQVGLTAMHTLFVREHNRLADEIRAANPALTGDEVYEHARALVAAEMQAITYREFLPRLLGPGAIAPYRGYHSNVNAGISNTFATAAYRVGHTMLSTQILRLGRAGLEISAGHLDLAEAFFAPQEIVDHGIEPLLRGLSGQRAQNVDVFVIDDVRNFLFGPPGSGGFDLASLNLQRGRDHGLPSYNAIRQAVGRQPARRFEDITPDPQVRAALASVYPRVDDVDPWVGLLAERHAPGAFVGPTLQRILADQFTRLRDGDRFWYESYLPPELVRQVEDLTLTQVIRLNTDIGSELRGSAFEYRPVCPADLARPYGALDVFDYLRFQDMFIAGDRASDFDRNGRLDIRDFLAFSDLFASGCAR